MKRIALITILLLSACAPAWEKPGATSDDLSKAEDNCHHRAEAAYPPALHQIMRQQAYTTTNKNACFGSQNLMDCLNTQDIYVPPQFETVDDNEKPRREAYKSCMQDEGWQPAQ